MKQIQKFKNKRKLKMSIGKLAMILKKKDEYHLKRRSVGGLARLLDEDTINRADRYYLKGHLISVDSIPNPKYGIYPISSYSTEKATIENGKLIPHKDKKDFGARCKYDPSRDFIVVGLPEIAENLYHIVYQDGEKYTPRKLIEEIGQWYGKILI